MNQKFYHMTKTARNHLENAVSDTKQRWGLKQAIKYNHELLDGMQYAAENHPILKSAHRDSLALGTGFSLYLVEHHYAVFEKHDKDNIIIAGLFHESMDIPSRLRELRKMTQYEIEELKRILPS